MVFWFYGFWFFVSKKHPRGRKVKLKLEKTLIFYWGGGRYAVFCVVDIRKTAGTTKDISEKGNWDVPTLEGKLPVFLPNANAEYLEVEM